MTDSILNTIKKMLGISPDDMAFDTDIIVYINASISKLTQVGVGPIDSILVVDEDTVWSSLTNSQTVLALCQQFVYLSVKSVFDPPGTSYHLTASNTIMDETLWRIKEQIELDSEVEV